MIESTPKNDISALDRAIQWAGGQAKLARILGVTRAAVNGWKRECKVPAQRARRIEVLSLGSIRANDLVGVSHDD